MVIKWSFKKLSVWVQAKTDNFIYRISRSAIWYKLLTSLNGGAPNMRLYSLLNCDGLSYPTLKAAVAASVCSANIILLASCSLSHFWNWSGLMAVSDLKWWWKAGALMRTLAASSMALSGFQFNLGKSGFPFLFSAWDMNSQANLIWRHGVTLALLILSWLCHNIRTSPVYLHLFAGFARYEMDIREGTRNK